ncbi:hypothetical protein [Actinosynnema sp. NPDC023587]|uniref:hypothetical protein n=1 Tax=Actinosynnema sp. NPDC023587 TaxID=3154695 RepID=UPI003409B277
MTVLERQVQRPAEHHARTWVRDSRDVVILEHHDVPALDANRMPIPVTCAGTKLVFTRFGR